jgi:calcineurin-like phosphoesterase family protein
MSATWFTSDTHFLHQKVAELRGFATPQEHGEALVRNWNAVVSHDDVVWHLGDVAIGHEQEAFAWVRQLNGHKRLITGNHDPCWPGNRLAWKHQAKWQGVFHSVQQYARIKLAGEYVFLSHFPYTGDHTLEPRYVQYRLRDEGAWLLHGHIHNKERVTGYRSIHIGLDAWDLRPVRDTEVIVEMHGIVSQELECD